MTSLSKPNASLAWLEARLHRIAKFEANEGAAAAASFAYFFALLTAYYILRPIREEMGAMLRALDVDALKDVFVYVFLVMLAAVPIFGWLVSRFSTRRIVPIVYSASILQLLAFWLVMSRGTATPLLAKAYFIWVSVFNLFVISLFWSLMASYWKSDQAKRLYGIIAAGGTAGALAGPTITNLFARIIGPTHLLLVAAVFLACALALAIYLQRLFADTRPTEAANRAVTIPSMLDGARRAIEDPYLRRIALWVLLANLISTYFYFEQARIVGAAIEDRTTRVELFARIDLAVSLLTLAAQIFGTARIIERLGLGMAIAALPLAAIAGFAALSMAPTLAVIIAIVVAERAVHFSLSSPAGKVLWTVVDPEDKYKAQNFIDTVVYRGGDAASGWYFDWLGKGLGLGTAGIAVLTLPLAAVWFWLSFDMARRHDDRASRPPAAETT